MIRTLVAALALACALSTAACQTAAVPGSITAGDLSAAAGTLPPKTLSGIEAKAAQVRKYALAACGVVPTIETIANIFAAANSGVATASNVANIVCKAVQGSTTYAASKAKPVPSQTVAAPVGSTVTGVAVVNGTPVRVTGKVVR